MTLFLFTHGGRQFALPGDDVLQVLPPGQVQDGPEHDGRALHRGRKLPLLRLPFGAPAGGAVREATFLLVKGADGEGLLQVDRAGGLHRVDAAAILPLPGYLFADGGASYDGLFPLPDGAGALLRTACLRGAGG